MPDVAPALMKRRSLERSFGLMLSQSQTSLRRAGRVCVAGAFVLAVGAFLTQIMQASTSVSDKQWSYPWSSGVSIGISLLWAFAQTLVVVGVLALRDSGVAGDRRSSRTGLAMAVLGTALIVVGHVASIPVREQTVDDTVPQIVGALFGLGTLLSAVGFLLVGHGVLRAGVWTDWRRFTPTLVGASAVALLGLQFTPALPSAVGVYALCLGALGIALAQPSSRAIGVSRPAPTASP